jgi:hypothetical protein
VLNTHGLEANTDNPGMIVFRTKSVPKVPSSTLLVTQFKHYTLRVLALDAKE